MSRYIDADTLMMNTHLIVRVVDDSKGMPHQQYETVIFADDIDDAPTVDAVPVVHGHWIRGGAYPHHIFCSNCYRTYVPNDESEMWKDRTRLPRKYCPECGAKMDEVAE